MLAIHDSKTLTQAALTTLLTRPATPPVTQVQAIIDAVKEYGDKALLAFTAQYDQVELTSLQVTSQALAEATVSEEVTQALKLAIANIKHYHQATIPQATTVSTTTGVTITQTYRPLQRVGFYVPGGNNTPLVSSLLMQAIPATLAGCPLKVLCTPPDSNGRINPALLTAARLCGIESVFTVGGAQAIAAMAYGTETIPRVDKLFGPGNGFVTAAKKLVSLDAQGAAIDMPAGPSEVLIIADTYANPTFVAADLLAQTEHDSDAQAILLCTCLDFAQAVRQSLLQQLQSLRRKPIITQALQHSFIVVVEEDEQLIALANAYAPEHLIINHAHAETLLPLITAAGTVFIGPWAAETLGDYVTGSNHILPTYGYARNYSGLSTRDFLTAMTVQTITENGILSLGKAACTLALLEGLDAHANAIHQRLHFLELNDVCA